MTHRPPNGDLLNEATVKLLLNRIAGGDAEAVKELFRCTQRPLLRLFYRLSRCPDVSEDLLQGTFLRLWSYRGTYQGQSARSYIYRVAYNEWRSSHTREKRLAAVKDEYAYRLDPKEVPTPESNLESSEMLHRVRMAVASLPEPQREAFLLHRVEGLSCREISITLGTSRKTIESRLRLAIQKLTSKLGVKGCPG